MNTTAPKKKCTDCNPCEDKPIRTGYPSPLPDCEVATPCSSIVSADCVVFDNLPGTPSLADKMAAVSDCCDNKCNISADIIVGEPYYTDIENTESGEVLRDLEVEVSNGSGSYEFLWSIQDTTPQHEFYESLPTDQYPTIRQSLSLGPNFITTLIKVKVTDNNTGCVATDYFFVRLIFV